MRNRARLLFKCGPVLLLGGLLFSTPLAAAETGDAARVPLKSMSQAEYEAYREQLQKQVKEAEVPEQGKAASETEQGKTDDGGYGRGYRSRTERSGRAGGGYRGGSMSRGGGRGR